MNLTYGQLADALILLGFERVKADKALVFREQEHGAVLVLPRVQPNEWVRPAHLIAAQHTVIGKGVADLDGFSSALGVARNGSTLADDLDAWNIEDPDDVSDTECLSLTSITHR